jgi:hypothetical protein
MHAGACFFGAEQAGQPCPRLITEADEKHIEPAFVSAASPGWKCKSRGFNQFDQFGVAEALAVAKPVAQLIRVREQKLGSPRHRVIEIDVCTLSLQLALWLAPNQSSLSRGTVLFMCVPVNNHVCPGSEAHCA